MGPRFRHVGPKLVVVRWQGALSFPGYNLHMGKFTALAIDYDEIELSRSNIAVVVERVQRHPFISRWPTMGEKWDESKLREAYLEERWRCRRRKKGLSLRRFARLAGVPEATLKKMALEHQWAAEYDELRRERRRDGWR